MVRYLIFTGPTETDASVKLSCYWSLQLSELVYKSFVFHDLGWKYLDRLPCLHGWHGLPGWTLHVTCLTCDVILWPGPGTAQTHFYYPADIPSVVRFIYMVLYFINLISNVNKMKYQPDRPRVKPHESVRIKKHAVLCK